VCNHGLNPRLLYQCSEVNVVYLQAQGGMLARLVTALEETGQTEAARIITLALAADNGRYSRSYRLLTRPYNGNVY